ncbi:hypothetical protein [Emticicia sp. 21SJ11W-3]|uniref:hypothetical protein n=1 Tax=Emticicia sp. 21SJ11W-3 TaxID=2916755 RepID=UPI00209D8945|nr:hypothetical protein [Emticicia sp. 21SJ11W-3]UTA66519.1 hypothetical protein MB380_13010 [Emticicia sp. 21SJ11W-3]
MSADAKHKHLDLVQGVISRMAQNSFIIKGWAITILTGLLAYGTSKPETPFIKIACLSIVPTLLFWILDAFYLSLEKQYRQLFDAVRKKDNDKIDYKMDVTAFKKDKNSWLNIFACNLSLLFFYLPLLLLPFIIACF